MPTYVPAYLCTHVYYTHMNTSQSCWLVWLTLNRASSLLPLNHPTNCPTCRGACCFSVLFLPLGLFLFFRGFCLFCFVFETGCCYVTQAGLKLLIFLPQPPNGGTYGYVPPHSAHSDMTSLSSAMQRLGFGCKLE